MSKKNIRNFSRYESKSMCEVRLGSNIYRGIVIDYSSEGIGVIIKNDAHFIEGAQADVKILDYDTEFKSEILWTEALGYHIRIGFRTLGNMKGNLKYYRLADILIGINRSKKTGTLAITTGSITRKIYVLNGNKLFAASTNKNDRLGEYLLTQGKITPEAFQEASSLISQKKQRLGKILVDLGYLKDSDLYQAVQDQVEAIILSLFNIEEGFFEFKEEPLPSEEPITLQISTANLIYKGITHINNVMFVQKMSPPLNTILNISKSSIEMFRSLKLESSDKLILSHVNGINTLQTIISLSPTPKFETLKIIIALLSIGVIHIKEDDEAHAALPKEILFSKEEETTACINDRIEREVPIEDTTAMEETFTTPHTVELIEGPADEEKSVPVESAHSDTEEFLSPHALDSEEFHPRNDKTDSDITRPPQEEAPIEDTTAMEETFTTPDTVKLIEGPADEEKSVPVESAHSDTEEFLSPHALDSANVAGEAYVETVRAATKNAVVSKKTGTRNKRAYAYVIFLFIILVGAGMPLLYHNIRTFFSASQKPTHAIVVEEKESTAVPLVTKAVSSLSFHDMAMAKARPGTSAPYPDFHREALRKLLNE